MRALGIAALVALALASAACIVRINNADYECLWTPTNVVVCVPAPVAMSAKLP